MIILFSIDDVCHVCCKVCLDTFEEHTIHCREVSRFKYRCDLIKDVLFDMFWRTLVSMKKEVLVIFFY